MECTFYVYTYWSASGYQQWWEVTNQRSVGEPDYTPLTVKPGDYILRVVLESDHDEARLFRAPQNPAQFETFKQRAMLAAVQVIYDRVEYILQSRRRTPAQVKLLDESNFDPNGQWLAPYLVASWQHIFMYDSDDGRADGRAEVPLSLEDALSLRGTDTV